MRCKYCGFGNGEDDHRCLRCGRRLAGIVIAAPSDYVGAAALSLDRHPDSSRRTEPESGALNGRSDANPQRALFSTLQPVPKVIPFEQVQRQATARAVVQEPAPVSAPAPLSAPTAARSGSPRSPARKPAPRTDAQGTLDFIIAPASRARTLRTSVEAQVYCDQPVATPMHRFVAGAIDAALILLGFGLFVIVCQAVGGAFGQGRLFWISLATAFTVISIFYGLIWAIAGRETAGMSMTDLQLITFDGFAVDGPARALRFIATWLSFCSGAIGLVWSLADEENLTWHDHISKTFPTIREVPRNFVRQR
ncbi:MAG TPA: RDD family protein [Bryobacteraceae bacterium]|jgi:uncharacterized RDD family membrane protein YckC|nr:RDD family protein [Bryobacteraceae bacterium]